MKLVNSGVLAMTKENKYNNINVQGINDFIKINVINKIKSMYKCTFFEILHNIIFCFC